MSMKYKSEAPPSRRSAAAVNHGISDKKSSNGEVRI